MKPLPGDTFYRLKIDAGSVSNLTGSPWTDKTIQVAKFRGSGLYRERAIAFSDHDEVIVKQHRYHLWIDSPERMLQNELIRYLRAAGAAPRISGSEAATDGFIIRGQIHQMDQVVEGGAISATVILAFELVGRGPAPPIFSREYRESRVVSSDEMRVTAVAMSDAVRAIFERFVVDATNALHN